MLFEFQFSSGRILTALRNRLRSAWICVPDAFPPQFPIFVVDRIRFPVEGGVKKSPSTQNVTTVGGGTQTVAAADVEIRQPVEALVVSLPKLKLAQGNPSEPDFVVNATLVFRISAGLDGGQAKLRLTVDDLELDPNAPHHNEIAAQIDAVKANLKGLGSEGAIPLDAFKDLVGGPLSFTNAAVSTDAGGSRIVVRFEVGPPNLSASAWTAFFNGSFDDHLVGNDWGIFVDRGLLEKGVSAMLHTALVAQKAAGKVDFGGISTTWSHTQTSATVTASFSGEAINGCGPIDVNFDADIDAKFTVPTPGVLRLSVSGKFHKTNWLEKGTCFVGLFTLFPIVGGVMAAKGSLDPVEYINDLANPFFAVLTILRLMNPPFPLEGLPAQCVKTGDSSAQCDAPFEVGGESFLPLRLETMTASSSGLTLLGSTIGLAEIEDSLVGAVSASGFDWKFEHFCTSMDQIATAKVTVPTPYGPTSPKFHVCEAAVRNDPLHLFEVKVTPLATAIEIALRVYYLKPYFDAPFAPELLLQTTGGARLMTLPTVSAPAVSDPATLAMMKKAFCTRPIRKKWKYEPDPALRPDPVEKGEIVHLWELAAYGLAKNHLLSVFDERGALVMTSTPGSSGIALASAALRMGSRTMKPTLVFDSALQSRLSTNERRMPLARSTGSWTSEDGMSALESPDPAADIGPTQLSVNVAEAYFRSTVSFRAPSAPVTLARVVADRNEHVAIAAANRVDLYRFDSIGGLAWTRRLRSESLRGACALGSRLLFWDCAGLHALELHPREAQEKTTLHRGSDLLDVSANANMVYVLRRSGLQSVDPSGHVINELAVGDAERVLAFRNWIVLGRPGGISVYSRGACGALEHAADVEVGRVVDLSRVPGPLSGRAALVRTERPGGTLLDLTEPSAPVVAATYYDDPWFVGTLAMTDGFLRNDASNSTISLYRLVETMTSDFLPTPGESPVEALNRHDAPAVPRSGAEATIVEAH